MTHPDALLADHVDGTLSERERAVVEAHLATCARCREEVELARAAVAALGELEEVPVPLGVTDRVVADANASAPRKAPVASRWQWAAGLAAAAAIVAVVAVSLTGPDGSDGIRAASPGASTGGGGGGIAGSEIPLEDQRGVNYDGDRGVLVIANEAIRAFERQTLKDGGEGSTGATLDAGGAESVSAAASEAQGTAPMVDPAPALRCLRRAEVPPAGANMTLVRLIEARYLGDPVYLAVFLQSPGADQPPDRAVVWVLDRAGCRIVNFLNVTFDALEAGTP